MHLLIDVRPNERGGGRQVKTRCGKVIPVSSTGSLADEDLVGWASKVTCPDCTPRTAPEGP